MSLKTIALAFCLLGTTSVWAQTAPEPPLWRGSVGIFTPSNVPFGLRYGSGATVSLEKLVREKAEASQVYGVALRHSTYTLSNGQRLNLSSASVEMRHYHNPNGERYGAYGGVGLGVVSARNTAAGSGTHALYSLSLGTEWSRRFVEARWQLGNHAREHGITLSYGKKW
jgi:hypothetical protein